MIYRANIRIQAPKIFDRQIAAYDLNCVDFFGFVPEEAADFEALFPASLGSIRFYSDKFNIAFDLCNN